MSDCVNGARRLSAELRWPSDRLVVFTPAEAVGRDVHDRPRTRRRLRAILPESASVFREELRELGTAEGFSTGRLATEPATADLPAFVDEFHERRRRLCWRAWVLESAPIGVTLAGPGYHDNPVVYATRAVERLTGYTAEQLRGSNLRRLQGPATDRRAVEDLRDAIRSWESVTVEVTNYRQDGTPFRNRVTLVPVAGPDGTVDHWFGLQARASDDREA